MRNFFKKINIFKAHSLSKIKKDLMRCDIKKGFSLFELLVAIAIMIMVSTAVFSSFPKMNSRLSLELLAQDIALTIRQAQIYGTTVYGAQGNFGAYGVDFPNPKDPSISPSNPYKITIFADLNNIDLGDGVLLNNRAYDGSINKTSCGYPEVVNRDSDTETECLQEFKIIGRNQIQHICRNYYVGTDELTLNSGERPKDARVRRCLENENEAKYPESVPNFYDQDMYQYLERTAIVFSRPNLGPHITISGQYGMCLGGPDCTNIGIVVGSDNGETRVVVVWANGQVSIDK